jgi:uncharacterized membrane protein YukC
MDFEKWSKIFKWIAIPLTAFFFLVIIWGIYLGVSGEQEFTFPNSQAESNQETSSP